MIAFCSVAIRCLVNELVELSATLRIVKVVVNEHATVEVAADVANTATNFSGNGLDYNFHHHNVLSHATSIDCSSCSAVVNGTNFSADCISRIDDTIHDYHTGASALDTVVTQLDSVDYDHTQ